MNNTAEEGAPRYVTTGALSLEWKVPDGKIDRLLRARKDLYTRVGRLRLIDVRDLPKVRAALGLTAPAPA